MEVNATQSSRLPSLSITGVAISGAATTQPFFGLVLCCLAHLWIGVQSTEAQVPRLGGIWTSEGPGPFFDGQVEGIPGRPVAGAIQAVAAHPENPDILYVGAVNGGIWRTGNATEESPSWVPQADDQPSLSISAIAFDPTDRSRRTLVAGIGHSSSYLSVNGERVGLLRTVDEGQTWRPIEAPELSGRNVVAVVPRGREIFFAVDQSEFTDVGETGVFRIDPTGTGLRNLSEDCTGGRALPQGSARTLAARPSPVAPLWAAMAGTTDPGDVGLYRRSRRDGCWDKVSHSAIDRLLAGPPEGLTRLAFGPRDNLYIGITRRSGSRFFLAGVFHTSDAGASWTDLGLPATQESDGSFGLHPEGQGDLHFSLAADPNHIGLFYLGGDLQPSVHLGPNSIGAEDYTARLFRGSHAPGRPARYLHLTHQSFAGGGTLSGTAPHADSRAMVFDAAGDLLEANDGGIYRRRSPQNAKGDWSSLNGDLRITELHNLARDPVSGQLFGGAQDTGVPLRQSSGGAWTSLELGDGGDAQAVPFPSGRESRWYWANESLNPGFRADFSPRLGLHHTELLQLSVTAGRTLDPEKDFYFTTPMAASPFDPEALVIDTERGVYESMDSGDHLRQLSRKGKQEGSSPFAYGARNAAHALYVARGSEIRVRQRKAGALRRTSFPGGMVDAITLDPEDWRRAFVLAEGEAFFTTDGGGSWSQAGSLPTTTPGPLVYFGPAGRGRLVFGGLGEIWIAFEEQGFATWFLLGDELPRTQVLDLLVDPNADIALAALFGRGAFRLSGVTGITPPPPVPDSDALASSGPEATADSSSGEADRQGPSFRNTRQPAILLVDGVLVDPTEGQIFLMAPENRLDVIDLATGKTRWSTAEVSKPLALTTDRRLVGQAEAQGDSTLRVGILAFEDGPVLDIMGQIPLPGDLRASIDEGPEGALEVIAEPETTAVRVRWRGPKRSGDTRGRVRRLEEEIAERPRGEILLELDSGRVRHATPLREAVSAFEALDSPDRPLPLETLAFNPVDEGQTLLYGRIEAVDDQGDRIRWRLERMDRASREVLHSVLLPAEDPVAGRPSADGRHVLVSTRLGDREHDRRFRWSVFDAMGNLVGALDRRHSGFSFLVNRGLLVTESPAGDSGNPDDQRQIVAIDLETAELRWQVPLRDPRYRGPRRP